jgi:hypothetical protein
MSIFSGGLDTKDVGPSWKLDIERQSANELCSMRTSYPIGFKFKYLGKCFVVISHEASHSGLSNPKVYAEYVLDDGRIDVKAFSFHNLDALIDK